MNQNHSPLRTEGPDPGEHVQDSSSFFPEHISASMASYLVTSHHAIYTKVPAASVKPTKPWVSERRFEWLSTLRWWLPELVASILSFASLATTVAVLRKYDCRSLNNLGLPKDLTQRYHSGHFRNQSSLSDGACEHSHKSRSMALVH